MAASQSSADGEVFGPAQMPAGEGTPEVYRRSFASGRVILALMLREMATRYVRTPGGYLWAVLEPVGFVALLSVGFSLMARVPPLGTSFLLFYASGFLPFSLYRGIEGDVSRAIEFSRPLLLYPAVTWLDAILARFLLGLITNIMILFIILGGAIAITGYSGTLDYVMMLQGVLAAAMLGLGVGTFNAFIHGRFPLIKTFWRIINRPLFLLSGVIFTFDSLPAKVQHIFWFNPLIHVTGLMHGGVYPSYQPHYISFVYIYGIAFVSLALGLLFLRAYSRDLISKE